MLITLIIPAGFTYDVHVQAVPRTGETAHFQGCPYRVCKVEHSITLSDLGVPHTSVICVKLELP